MEVPSQPLAVASACPAAAVVTMPLLALQALAVASLVVAVVVAFPALETSLEEVMEATVVTEVASSAVAVTPTLPPPQLQAVVCPEEMMATPAVVLLSPLPFKLQAPEVVYKVHHSEAVVDLATKTHLRPLEAVVTLKVEMVAASVEASPAVPSLPSLPDLVTVLAREAMVVTEETVEMEETAMPLRLLSLPLLSLPQAVDSRAQALLPAVLFLLSLLDQETVSVTVTALAPLVLPFRLLVPEVSLAVV